MNAFPNNQVYPFFQRLTSFLKPKNVIVSIREHQLAVIALIALAILTCFTLIRCFRAKAMNNSKKIDSQTPSKTAHSTEKVNNIGQNKIGKNSSKDPIQLKEFEKGPGIPLLGSKVLNLDKDKEAISLVNSQEKIDPINPSFFLAVSENQIELACSLLKPGIDLNKLKILDPKVQKALIEQSIKSKNLAALDQLMKALIINALTSVDLTNENNLMSLALDFAKSTDQKDTVELLTQAQTQFEKIRQIKEVILEDYFNVSKEIKTYGIEDPFVLIEIAKLAAQKNGRYLSESIQNYGIQDQAALIDIAKLAAQQNGEYTSMYIQNYGIKDQAALIDIAKLAAQYFLSGTCKYIQNYGIKDQAALIEIAKISAQHDLSEFSKYIQNYGIKDQAALIEIAKISARKSPSTTCEHIQRYGIKDQAALIEIAKLAAQQNYNLISFYIQNFGIQDQATLIYIAKLAAQQDGESTSACIQKYCIKDQDALIEIAKLSIQQCGGAISEHIQKYGIKNQVVLVEIAKLAAKHSGAQTSLFIQNFGIKDQADLIDIAKLAAQQNGGYTSMYIQNYGIKDQTALVEIAKLAAQQNGKGTSNHIKDYDIKNPEARLDIFLQAFKNDTKSLEYYKKFNLSKEDWPIHHFLTQLSTKPVNFSYQTTLTQLQKVFEENWPGQFSQIFEKLAKKEDERGISWSIFTSGLLSLHKKALPSPDLWLSLFQYPDPKMRYTLSEYAMTAFEDKEKVNIFNEFYQKTKHLKLTALFFCNQADPQRFKSLNALIKKQKAIFKDGKAIRALIDTLQLLAATDSLEPKTIAIIEEAIKDHPKDKILQNLFSIQGIKACQGNLDDVPTKGLDQVFLETFKKVIPIHDMHNFSQVFLSTFGENSSSLLTYAGKLKTLPDSSKLLQILGEFTTSVLEGTFTESRYMTQYSPHLEELFKNHIHLKEAWMSNQRKDLVLDTTSFQAQINCKEFLKTKILIDKHFNLSGYPYLEKALENTPENPRDKILKELTEKLQEMAKDKTQQKSQELVKLYLQKDLIGLIDTPKSNQLALLNRIHKWLSSLSEKQEEFLHDIDGLIAALTPKKSLSNKFEAVFTDHFLDLLLCGTQVAGSCQRVDGNSNLNKCLLAYLLDGKIRLLAIKDEKGKIVARSIIRLLMQKEGKPVLMQERIYPDALNPTLQEKLDEFAIQQAKRLNLPLYRSGKSSINIISKGGRSPWEYVDSANGVTNGIYTITKGNLIFSPVKK